MKARTLLLSLALLGVVALPAQAHFRLDEPADALVVETGSGDPTGGDQKTPPCGVGTKKSNKVTKVAPGGKIHIKIKETIQHGGHYRVALVQNRDDLKDPVPETTATNCVSAPIQDPPVAPILADGLFKHAQADTIPAFWETDITVPNQPCANCTLQIIEFMTPHAPQCFYHHCATVDVNASAPADGGVVVEEDAGSTTDPETPPGDDGEEPSSSSGKPSSNRKKLSSQDSSGCAMPPAAPNARFALYFALAASLAAFRRARKRDA
jgi:hypothetical protein